MSRRKPPRRKSQDAHGSGPQRATFEPNEHLVAKNDGNWWVRKISGAASTKTYRCPGCQQTIAPATPHLVAWPEVKSLLSAQAVDERRHWHRGCWDRKP